MFERRRACQSARGLASGVTLSLMGTLCMGSGATQSQSRTNGESSSAGTPSQADTESQTETGGYVTGELSGIEPQAERILQAMSDYLKSASEFAFHADVAYDSVLADGQKLQFGGAADVFVRRPDRLHVEYRGDERMSRVVFDGQMATLCDLVTNVYSQTEVPPTLDAAVDHVFDKYGITVPIADLAYADPYQTLTESVETGSLVGEHIVRGTACQHLAFTQEAIDWQIWIEDGPQPLPRKLLITYKEEEGSPQYTAWLSRWDLRPRISDHYFHFNAPAGSDKIEFLPTQEPEVEP